MKTNIINRSLIILLLMISGTVVQAQYVAAVPGDNFSLEGALEIFKQSSTPQEFEQMLNDPDSKVNNLDLNGDGYIDYIRVLDRNENNVHLFVMQAVISEYEFQDVAVITLEKLAYGKAILQIIGDEDIYGVETIIEPTREVRTYGGTNTSRVVVNVWAWPAVRYIYGPYYSIWVSPWGWHYRPDWWFIRRPAAYYDYYGYWRPYTNYYTTCHTHRVVYYQNIYRPHRTTSVLVYNRHQKQISSYRSKQIKTYNRQARNTSRSSISGTINTVQYDSNGRLRSAKDQRLNTGSSESSRFSRTADTNSTRTTVGLRNQNAVRSSSEIPARTADSNRRSSAIRISETTRGNANVTNVKKERTNANTYGSGTSVKSNSGTYKREYSSSTNAGQIGSRSSVSDSRTSNSADVRRSTGSASRGNTVRQSYGNSSELNSKSNVRATRSAGNTSVRGSAGNASKSSDIRQVSGNSSGRKTSGDSEAGKSAESSRVRAR